MDDIRSDKSGPETESPEAKVERLKAARKRSPQVAFKAEDNAFLLSPAEYGYWKAVLRFVKDKGYPPTTGQMARQLNHTPSYSINLARRLTVYGAAQTRESKPYIFVIPKMGNGQCPYCGNCWSQSHRGDIAIAVLNMIRANELSDEQLHRIVLTITTPPEKKE